MTDADLLIVLVPFAGVCIMFAVAACSPRKGKR